LRGTLLETKPRNIDEYRTWLSKAQNIVISDRTETHYNSVALKVKQDYEGSAFWSELGRNLPKYDEEYLVRTGYPLLISKSLPSLDVKKFNSFLLKTFRKNILNNQQYPNPPTDGWIIPDNWFSRINDIVRTTLVVKYLDGVEFLKEKFGSLCVQHGMEFRCFLEAREEGYYAAHLYTIREFEVPRENWDTRKIPVQVEVQITTQLQEVIKRLLHKYFEARRVMSEKTDLKWQWDYKSDEFIANYLGHILHYVEGMIMEVRDRQEEKKG
jgi:hypothetical protein